MVSMRPETMRLLGEQWFSKCKHLANFSKDQLTVYNYLLDKLTNTGELYGDEFEVLGNLYMLNQYSYNSFSKYLSSYRMYVLLVKTNSLLPPDTEFEIHPDSEFHRLKLDDIIGLSEGVLAKIQARRKPKTRKLMDSSSWNEPA